MFQWISDNSSTISVVANVAMVLVWVTYLQLLLASYRRQRQSTILINRGAGSTLDARCLVSNMSAEPIYVQNIIATLKCGEQSWKAAVTDLEDFRSDEIEHAGEATNQGPLGVGDYADLGRFKYLAWRAARNAGVEIEDAAKEFDAIELTVVAAYGPDKYSVAARREYRIDNETGNLTPTTLSSIQIRSRRERREIDRYLQQII